MAIVKKLPTQLFSFPAVPTQADSQVIFVPPPLPGTSGPGTSCFEQLLKSCGNHARVFCSIFSLWRSRLPSLPGTNFHQIPLSHWGTFSSLRLRRHGKCQQSPPGCHYNTLARPDQAPSHIWAQFPHGTAKSLVRNSYGPGQH